MITGQKVKNKPYLTQMTALDAMICMEFANSVDPFRGRPWMRAFDQKARLLGYRAHAHAVCHCPGVPHGPECGLVKTTKYPPETIFHFDPTDNPADGIVDTPAGYPFLPVYEDVDGYHRHQCPECQTIWEHSDDRAGSRPAHTCPACGFYRPGWATVRTGDLSTYSPYDGHRGPDYSERFNVTHRFLDATYPEDDDDE